MHQRLRWFKLFFPSVLSPILLIHTLTATHLSSDPCDVNYIVPCQEFPARGENDFLLLTSPHMAECSVFHFSRPIKGKNIIF